MSVYEIFREAEESYIKESDWEVKENANELMSYGNFLSYFLDKVLKREEILTRVFPEEAVRMHLNGDIHIHKLPLSLHVPYCVGWSLPKILKTGLKTPTVISRAPRHFDSAINQLINFIFLTAQEWSGAMATSAFDLYLAPFVNKDKLEDKKIKQALQSMCFELNYPSRMGFQSPFSNVTIVLDTVKSFLNESVIIDGKGNGVLGDYIDDAIRIVRQLINLYNEGDALGQPFTFPIPTIMLTKEFDWNDTKWNGLVNDIFENLALRGSFYLLNGYSTNVEALYAMCCRLTIDVSKVTKVELKKEEEEVRDVLEKGVARGIWAIPDATGSIGVITINLPRIAFLSNGDENKFEQLLIDRLEVARKTLNKMRERYERSLRVGLMPMTRVYLGTLNNHFNTFGLVGLPEAAANFLKDANLWFNLERSKVNEAVKWMKYAVGFVRKYSEELSDKEGILYNVEEVPAESTAYRLAIKDYKMFRDQILFKEYCMPMEDGVPFYSNSIVPYYANMSIAERAKLEGEVQNEFTGGVMMHLFLYESIDTEALKKLIHKIAINTKVAYFSITPTIAVCEKCGWRGIGVYKSCPKCNGKVTLWSRIVGYYKPVNNWNIGKKAEFLNRAQYGAKDKVVFAKEILGREV